MDGEQSWVRKVWFSGDGARVVAVFDDGGNGSKGDDGGNGSKSHDGVNGSKGGDGVLQGWDVASGAVFCPAGADQTLRNQIIQDRAGYAGENALLEG